MSLTYSNPTVIIFPLISEIVSEPSPTVIPQSFADVAAMLAANPASFLHAVTMNYEGSDGLITTWLRIATAPPPAANGDKLRQTTYAGRTDIFLQTFP
jgi:hypothetical protein